MAGISVILCASLRLTSIVGIWNLRQVAFYAIGAYTSALLMIYYDVSFWLVLPLSGIVAAVFALGFGYLTIRVRGIYFLLLTLVLVEIVRLTITGVYHITGVQHVMKIPPHDPIVIPHLLRIEFISKTPYYYLILICVIIILAVPYMIERSRIGAVLKSIAASEPLCESIGIDTTRYRIWPL